MADEFDFSDLGAEPVTKDKGFDFSDLGAEPVGKETKSSTDETYDPVTTSLIKGVQGFTMGLPPKIQGVVGGALRAGGVSGYGTGKDYSFEGPTLSPEELMKSYEEAQNSYNTALDTMQKERPRLSSTAMLAGGMASSPFLPQAPLIEGASLVKNLIPLAKTGAAYGGVNSALESRAETPEDLVSDIGTGSLFGAGLGTGIPLALQAGAKGVQAGSEGLKSLGRGIISKSKAILPEIPLRAYEKALNENIDVTSIPEFYEPVGKQEQQIVKQISEPISNKIKNIDSKLSELKKDTQSMLQRGDEIALNENIDATVSLAKDQQNLAENIQSQLNKTRDVIKSQFDKNDAAIMKSDVKLENNNVLSNLEQNMLQRGATKEDIAPIMEKVTKYYGDDSLAAYKNLKADLANFFNHKDFVVRGAAKQAYSQLNESAMNALRGKGYDTLANNIGETNSRWKAMLNLEDKYLSNISRDSDLASTDTTGLIKKFISETDPSKLAEQAGFEKSLRQAMSTPETIIPGGPSGTAVDDLMFQLRSMGQRAKDVQNLPIPSTALSKALPNPEIAKLQLAKDQLGTLGETPQDIEKQIFGLLPKYKTQSGDTQAEQKFEDIFNFLSKEIGPEKAQALRNTASKTAEDLKLRKAVFGGVDTSEALPTSTAGALVRGGGGMTKAGAKLGKALQPSQKIETQFLQTGVGKLSSASPEELTTISQKFMADPSKASQAYGRVLEQSVGKSKMGKDAVMFGLMQQPDFRELFNFHILDNKDTKK